MSSRSSAFRSVLITGVSGLVGSAVYRALKARRLPVTGLTGKGCFQGESGDRIFAADLTDLGTARRVLLDADPDLVVNCAACPDIAPCESDPALARRLNAELPAFLAAACAEKRSRFVHFSTDQVFDGMGTWYKEEERPSPVHEYGRSKVEGERAVLEADPDAVVIRTSLVYGRSPSGARSSSEVIVRRIRSGGELGLFTNEYRTPVLVEDLAEAAVNLAGSGFSGIIHAAGPDRVNRLEFGRAVAARFGFDEGRLKPALSKGLEETPKRPLDLSLDSSLASSLLPSVFRGIDAGLATLS